MLAYIDLLKATRAEIIRMLKREGSLSADALADRLSISKVAVRRHLEQLEQRGLVRHSAERSERGRPRYVYSLTAEGDGLFPDGSAAFACDLLAQLGRTLGGEAVERLLADQTSRLISNLKQEVAGLDFDGRVAAVARQFDDRGYVADVERLADGSYLVVEHNCPIREVASQYPRVCQEELRVYCEVTGASVYHSCCRIARGAAACEYRIVPDSGPRARRLPIVHPSTGGRNDV